MVQIFHHRSARLLIIGQTISNVGDGISSVAFTLLVLSLTHKNASDIAVFTAFRMIPLVGLLLVSGVIVDRYSRRVLLMVSDIGRTVITGAIVALAATGELRFWMLVLFGVAFGAFDALFMPAISAMMPQIVPEDLLTAMNAVRPLSNSLGGAIIGPAIGGFLAAWSTSTAIGIDAATFAVSALTLSVMRGITAPPRSGTASMWAEIREGLYFVRTRTWVWSTLALAGFTNAFIFIPTFTFMGLFIVGHLHAAKFWVGLVFVAGGISGTIATFFIGSLPPPRHRIKVMYAAWITAGAAADVYCFAGSVWFLLLIPVVMSPLLPLGNVIWETMLQKETPNEMLGRIASADWFVSLAIAPVGVAIAGPLIGAVGFAKYFSVAVLLCELPCVFAAISPSVNAVDAGRGSRDRGAMAPPHEGGPMTGLPVPLEGQP